MDYDTWLAVDSESIFYKHISQVPLNQRYALRNSPRQPSKDILNIRIVASGFGNSDTQLRVAERSDCCDNTCNDPHDESKAHWTGIFQHSLWTDKDSRSNDVTWKRKKTEDKY